ncbi:MAG: phenylalanine--tRNA ligase subunit alpha [Ignavibacteria bacterium]
MLEHIAKLREELEADISSISTEQHLEAFRVKYLARKGRIASLFDELRNVPPHEKPSIGKHLNELRQYAQRVFDEKRATLQARPAPSEDLDLTLPGRRLFRGSNHPIMQTLDEIKAIFVGMGFGIADGPEIEDDWHNFSALNFPPDHPARDMQDTFFVSHDIVLRTHTSPVQIRVMETHQPPIRSIMPGRVFRKEAVTARSLCNFYQVEGLAVDVGITFSELKGTLVSFARQFYGSNITYRFRPSFFPFTEPSAEMDITCFLCNGKGCRLCKQSGWLEILGCGMVDPNVFRSVGYDAEKYTGYAFGMGIERTAALLYGVDDIRLFYENDVRFLKQFS